MPNGRKLRLLCLLFPSSDPSKHTFLTELDESDIDNKLVAELKDTIKVKKAPGPQLNSIRASNLILWKCDIPFGG
ncbi:hypothetical protein CPB84DRAFT_1791975, partial [Gymnopilus junonius]